MINRARAYYILILPASGILVLLFPCSETYMVLYTVILLPVASLLTTLVSIWLPRIQSVPESEYVIKDEEISCKIHIKSIIGLRGLKLSLVSFPHSLGNKSALFKNNLSTDIIDIRHATVISHSVSFPYRGEYRVGIEYLELSDPLGLFTLRRKVSRLARVMVYPRVTDSELLPILEAFTDNIDACAFMMEDDYTSVIDVRKYTETDNYKKIHWKLSAKKNELIVKNYQSSSGAKFRCFINTSSAEFDVEDAVIESVLAFTNHIINQNMHVELIHTPSPGEHSKIEASDDSGFHMIYSHLAQLTFTNDADITAALFDHSIAHDDYCIIVVFTHVLTERICESLLDMQARSYALMLVFITKNDSRHQMKIFDELKSAGIECAFISVSAKDDSKAAFA